jgi:hypothetical protein
MCKPASFVVTKDRIYWSKSSDSHEDIIKENDLKESNIRSEIQFVRVEICPPGGDFRMPLEKWRYKTDQDLLPEWYVEPEEEKRVRDILPEWLKAKVILPEQTVTEIRKPMVAIYGTVKYIDGGTVKYIDGGTVKYIHGGTVEYIRGGTVEYIDGGTVKYIDYGTVKSIRGGTVKSIRGGTVKYIHGGTVEYIDGGTVESIDGGTVGYIRGQLSRVTGNPTIINYGLLTPDILKSSQAVLVDRSKGTVVSYVGKDI